MVIADSLGHTQIADASLSDFGASDVAPSTGIHVKSHFKSNGNGRGLAPHR
jgi:hypothetical protein